MDSNPDQRQDLRARLDAQREKVRRTVDRMVDYLSTAQPESPLEAFRILRGSEIADRILVRVYTPTEEVVERDRQAAERRAGVTASRARDRDDEDRDGPYDAYGFDENGNTSDDDDRTARQVQDAWYMRQMEKVVVANREEHRRTHRQFDAYCAAQDAKAQGGPDPDPGDFFDDPHYVAELRKTDAYARIMRDIRRAAKAEAAGDTAPAEANGQAVTAPVPSHTGGQDDTAKPPDGTSGPRIRNFDNKWPP